METASFLDVDPEWVVLTNGLDEGVLLTAIAYLGARTPAPLVAAGAPLVTPSGQPEVVMALPAFETYISTAKPMGAHVVTVPPGPDFAFPVDALLSAVNTNTRLIYINNPNNPTGQRVSKDDIRRVIREAGHALIFLDEAYQDFMGENFLDEALTYSNVIVGRTFSKAHGLAGMRAGVMIAQPDVLEPIRRVMPLFNLNVVAVAALRAAIADTEFTPWFVDQATRSKEMFYQALDRHGLRYWRSAANFILVDGGAHARALIDGLIAGGVLVRDRTREPHCANCFRITAGPVEHTQKAIEVLEAVCARL